MTTLAQPQLHKRSQCSTGLSRAELGYLGVVIAASFGQISRMWPQVTPKASDAVSNPTRTTGEVGIAEGSSPSLPAERVTALNLYSQRVVVSESFVSGPLHTLTPSMI